MVKVFVKFLALETITFQAEINGVLVKEETFPRGKSIHKLYHNYVKDIKNKLKNGEKIDYVITGKKLSTTI